MLLTDRLYYSIVWNLGIVDPVLVLFGFAFAQPVAEPPVGVVPFVVANLTFVGSLGPVETLVTARFVWSCVAV